MKLARYLADYIEQEAEEFIGTGHIPEVFNYKKVIQQGIEAFESTEGVTLTILEKGIIRNKITGKRHRI